MTGGGGKVVRKVEVIKVAAVWVDDCLGFFFFFWLLLLLWRWGVMSLKQLIQNL